MINLAITTDNPDLAENARALAQTLNLPYITDLQENYAYLLILSQDHLALQPCKIKGSPLTIDFLAPQLTYRRKHASLRKELLARALGLKTKAPRRILDATLGLGRDSFILASLGFEMDCLERSPIIHALLMDSLSRAKADPEVDKIVQRMHVFHAQALDVFNGEKRWDIIYFDPMFPENKKSALSKQNMRIFHDIVGDDTDADTVFKAALTCANQRVVVKRPRRAEPLAGMKPSLTMEGSSNRFDIYLI